ncbi:unnamed protein product [Effrenium voratum]|nr:unnamed protein product [Effrenium voratum]
MAVGSKRRKFSHHPSHSFDCACGTDSCQNVCHQGYAQRCRKCLRSDSDELTQHLCDASKPVISAFDMALRPPLPSEQPKQVVILMRHGDRTPVRETFGDLDVTHMAASWQSLLPREMEKSAMDSVVVQREEGEGYNSYQQFVGSGHLGQLTSLGHRQCRRSGEELRRRYPTASIRAFSTDFQRTIQSAASVLVGFGADAPVVVRAPRRQVLLPNYDGRCGRYVTRRAALLAAANGGTPCLISPRSACTKMSSVKCQAFLGRWPRLWSTTRRFWRLQPTQTRSCFAWRLDAWSRR